MSIDTSALRAATEGATPGPWESVKIERGQRGLEACVLTRQSPDRFSDEVCGTPNRFDSEFIAAANPAVVLELLDRLDEVTAERNELLDESADHEATGYVAALKWAADVAHAEARWQYEQDMRGTVGAQIVAQRAQVLERCYREAAERYEAAAKAPRSDGQVEVAPESVSTGERVVEEVSGEWDGRGCDE